SAAEPVWLQHQEGSWRSGCAQSNPAAGARDRAAAPGGDTRGMGHRDPSEKFGSESAVCGVDCGFSTAAERKSVGVRAALFALRCYKAYLSTLFAGSCRFVPTCSMYAYEAIERFGVMRGVWLGTKRLLRCHPLSRKFGYDPVPESWEEMNANHVDGKTEVHS